MIREFPVLSPSLQKLNPHIADRESKRTKNARQGRAAQASGTRFEDEAEAWLRANPRVAHVTRCDARVRATGDRVLYREASGCDFVGLFVGGVAFVVECKSVARHGGQVFATEAHAIAQRRPRAPFVTDAQREQLDAYAAHGIATLYVRFGAIYAAFPWSAVRGLAAVDSTTPGGVSLDMVMGA